MNRLVLAAFLAVLIHAIAFWMEFPGLRSALVVPSSRAVDIQLVTIHPPKEPTAPPAPPKIKPAPRRRPATEPVAKIVQPPPKPRPKPKPKPEPESIPKPSAVSEVQTSAPLMEPDQEPVQRDTLPEAAAIESPAEKGLDMAPATSEAEPPVNEIDTPAELQASVPLYHLNPPPRYPPAARRRNYQGTVTLDVLVTAQGRPAEIRVAESSGYAILDRSAVKTVHQWRFAPARKGRFPVDMWVRVPVRFELR